VNIRFPETFTNMKKVLITGGFGFIGLRLAKLFADHNIRVILMDNLSAQIHGATPMLTDAVFASPFVHCLRGDVRNVQDWKIALDDVSTVVHLAAETGTAQSMYEIARYTDINVGGTAILMDILANGHHSVEKVVLASSRSVYGEGAYNCARCGVVYPLARTDSAMRAGTWEPVCSSCGNEIAVIATHESARVMPSSIYAATKLAQEDLVRIAGGALNIATVIMRLQNVYGEGQSLKNPYTGILSIFSNKLRQGKPIYLYEDGKESRDFVHAEDVVHAIFLATTKTGADGKTLNVGSGKPTTVAELAGHLKDCFNDRSVTEISGEYRLGDIRHSYADITSMRTALGWAPRIDLAVGIKRFTDWVKAQPLEPDRLDQATQELVEKGLMGQNR
jgi:dTDP-L-rhamnose 4-epimerase